MTADQCYASEIRYLKRKFKQDFKGMNRKADNLVTMLLRVYGCYETADTFERFCKRWRPR